MRFEWDIRKSRLNQRKHGFSFDEAMTVFGDPNRIEIFDEGHTEHEALFRRRLLRKGRLLFVAFTPRGEITRIIHARRAGK